MPVYDFNTVRRSGWTAVGAEPAWAYQIDSPVAWDY